MSHYLSYVNIDTSYFYTFWHAFALAYQRTAPECSLAGWHFPTSPHPNLPQTFATIPDFLLSRIGRCGR